MRFAIGMKTVLVQAAWAAVRTKNSYYRAQFLRLRASRTHKGDRRRCRLHVDRDLLHPS